jgi:hypothetical protein
MSVIRTKQGYFAPGTAGGPGRPRGARDRLAQAMLATLSVDWEQHGAEVLERVRARWPQVYLSVMASLLPKERIHSQLNPLEGISDDELAALEEHLAAIRAKTVLAIEMLEKPVIVEDSPRAESSLPRKKLIP